MPRTAALLCIHNEANRLGWWIAHHVAAGFSALLICDDHSTDGSQEILTQAARNYDIRLLATDQRETDRLQRHQNALTKMLRQEGGHFDWVIQLTVDEYFLPEGGSVSAFFAKTEARLGAKTFQQITHLPINWCLTGLGKWTNQIFDGQMAHPRALFHTHASEAFPDSRVTRSFFRPAHQRQGLPDPFAYVQNTPDWSTARILHDAAASSPTPQMRRYYNRNDQYYDRGQALLPKTLDISAHILQGLILGACYAIQNGQSSPAHPEGSLPEKTRRFKRFHLHRGEQKLVMDNRSRTISFQPIEELRDGDEFVPLCLIRPEAPSTQTEHLAWLYAEQPITAPYLPVTNPTLTYFPTLLDCLPVRLQREDHEAVRLSLYPTGLSLPDDEPVTLIHTESSLPSGPDPVEKALQFFTIHGFSAAGLREAIRQSRWLSPSVIGALYAQLPKQEAQTLFSPLLYQLFHDWKL
ncbi:glycosyltransferase family 2 protein [Bombella intestini]|uniref:glycosyltransferase family 2 protein n=1 Tax=Bombella intestini TaxID=1539051 RepID=UPI0009869493|nr:glycosyltransferase family 2 protein [Bombella intestini]